MCLDSEDVYRSTAHATCSCDGRQEGGECRNGYSLYYFPDFTFHSLIVSLNSSIFNFQFSIFNFQFSIFNFQFPLGLRLRLRLLVQIGADRLVRVVELALVTLRNDDVAQLQGAGILESLARQVAQLCAVRQEAQVNGSDAVARIHTSLDFGDADTLDAGVEDTQFAQLHGDALCAEFGQTLGDLDEDRLDVAAVEHAAVVYHVLCEASDGERLLTIHLRIPLAESQRLRVVVFAKIDAENGLVSFTHNS